MKAIDTLGSGRSLLVEAKNACTKVQVIHS
jgi:hypothetical protein